MTRAGWTDRTRGLWLRIPAAIVTAVMLTVVVASSATAGTAGMFQIGDSTCLIDGEPRDMGVAPFIDEQHRTMVPVRFVAYAVGVAEEGIVWRPREQLVMLTSGDVAVLLVVGEPFLAVLDGDSAQLMGRLFQIESQLLSGQIAAADVDPDLRFLLEMTEQEIVAWLMQTLATQARLVPLDTAPQLRSGRVFLPARHVAEAFGFRVGWQPNDRMVTVGRP